MLQPQQLKDVSIRYTKEIAELKDFLVKADCAVGTAETLGGITARLPRDRAFRRDLTSHVWVVIHRSNGQISYSDLLGVLAIAAVGTSLAAAADEDDAHELLRFLMEARRSLDAVPEDKGSAPIRSTVKPAAILSTEPLRSIRNDRPEVFDAPLQLQQRDLNPPNEPEDLPVEPRRRISITAVACLIAVLSIGLWLKFRPVEDVDNTSASSASNAVGKERSASATQIVVVSPSSTRPVEPADKPVMPSPRASSSSPVSPTARSSRPTPATASALSLRATDVPSQSTVTAPISSGAVRPPASSTVAPSTLRAAGIASTTAVGLPAATPRARFGLPSLPSDPADQGRDIPAVRTSKGPILLRRRSPASSSAGSDDGANLVSEARPAGVPGSLGTGSPVSARGGTVRLVSLGTMAANLMYSPVPTYPAAASASHVQGEVKVKAEIDRDGNVTSVRVVSGPPLLRDATLDAVQRWRYRPYMSSGEPIPMTAETIMDFQLP